MPDMPDMSDMPDMPDMPKTFANPVSPRGADPFVTKYNGVYYYCYAVAGGVNVTSAPAPHLIRSIPGEAVYRAPEGTEYSKEYWAPELHRIDGRWIIYVAADDGDNFHHRMYALGALTDDPCGPFEMLGKVAVAGPYDKWAIDGTVLTFRGVHYFIWSGWAGNVNVQQNLYIARMKDAVTLDSPRFLISEPEFDWETRSCGVANNLPAINEGPVALQRGGRTFVVYSASGSWSDDYCLGMLELAGDDPLDPRAWKKFPEPVFSPCAGSWGTGHCSFTTSPDGNEDYIVYHANSESGTGWHGRSVRVQKFTWENGVPVFGKPAAPGVEMPVPSNGPKRINTVLFDLDGTLIPMEQETFVETYMEAVCRKMAEFGYRPGDVRNALWKGTYAMIDNDGRAANHDVFWKVFSDLLGPGVADTYDALCRFYENEFDGVRSAVDPCFAEGKYPAKALIGSLKAKGYRVILATNPVFPAGAVKTRLNWIGLEPGDFSYITTYENSRFCKPNVRYYEEIICKAGGDPDHCLMVGNSVAEDMTAAGYGMDCFLITDFIENPENADYSAFKHGSFADFVKYAGENL